MEGRRFRCLRHVRVADQHPPHLRIAMLLLDSDLLYLPLLKILSNYLIQSLKYHNEFLILSKRPRKRNLVLVFVVLLVMFISTLKQSL